MFLSKTRSAFLATLVLHVASLPQPKKDILTLTIKFPPTVDNVEDFFIIGTLKNIGSKDITVVKDPDGILIDDFTAHVLEFKNKKDENPTFVGDVAKWSLETYLTYPGEEDKAVPEVKDTKTGKGQSGKGRRAQTTSDLSDEDDPSMGSSQTSADSDSEEPLKFDKPPPETIHPLKSGQTMEFKYNVGYGYDFTNTGAGAYTVKLWRDYFWVLIDGVITKAKIDVQSSTVNINGKLAADIPTEDDEAGGIDNRAVSITTRKCSPLQELVVNRAAEIADDYLSESRSYLYGMNGSTERFEYWFGPWDIPVRRPQYAHQPRKEIEHIYGLIRDFTKPANQIGYTYDCSCKKNMYGQVRKNKTEKPTIKLCTLFRSVNTPLKGTDSKAGTLIHEATHFNYGAETRDFKYGQAECHDLAMDNPYRSAINADNYQYFSENDPYRE